MLRVLLTYYIVKSAKNTYRIRVRLFGLDVTCGIL